MCGVLFAYDSQQAPDERSARGRRALQILAHRGPDESADLEHGGAWLGHRRLSIIDLAASHQPMLDPSQRFALSYNGEIYNYAPLRADLSKRWTFRTGGDTEVLLAGLILDGPRFLDRLEGMWAFVLWDGQERRLLAARDRFGKKPLYYCAPSADILICGSELPAVKQMTPATAWDEDLDSTADYLRYGFALPGRTAFTGVREVLPAHWLEWSPSATLTQSRYWSLPVGRFQGTREEASEQIRERVRQAVQLRLVADIEVGSLLSGGIDSTIVTSLAAEAAPQRLKTFTAGFSDASYDETVYARLVSAQLGCEHFEDRLNLDDPAAIRELISGHVGQPFADPSLMPTALVARLTARSVKVALSGDGGDEMFCGYERYRARALLRWYTRLPASLRGGAARLIQALPEPTAHHSGSLLKKAHLFLRQAEQRQRGTAYVAPELFDPALRTRLAPTLADRGHASPALPAHTGLDDIEAMMRADALMYLPQDILQKTDRASMAHSLELRAPFLDRSVVELALSLPTQWQSGLTMGKRLLRTSFAARLPARIARRGKQGFAVPVGAWFRGPLGVALQEMLARDAGPLNPREVEGVLAEHRSGKRDHGLRLWAVYVYLLCREQRVWSST